MDFLGSLVHSRTEFLLRSIRYFADLLEAGYRQALNPNFMPGSLRATRIALGIDLPELDTVPLWSVKRSDGMVSIPFIEFIIAEIRKNLKALSAEAGLDRETVASLNEGSHILQRVLDAFGAEDGVGSSLPRLKDVFVSPRLLEEIAGPEGPLGLILRQCELALVEPVVGSTH